MKDILIQLGIGLTDVAARNGASSIRDKITSVKSKKNDKQTIETMEEIINDLISDKHEVITISKAFEEEIAERKISEKDIEYITEEFIPVIEKLLLSTSEPDEAENLNSMISILKPIISVETLTVLQLIGFNFKKGIGEPLTHLISEYIKSKQPMEKTTDYELQKLNFENNIQFYKMLNDLDAYERYKEVSRQ